MSNAESIFALRTGPRITGRQTVVASVISLDASNCRTGDTIEKRQVQAESQETVLKALGSAAEQLRRGLGESLASIGKYDAPIRDATAGDAIDGVAPLLVAYPTSTEQVAGVLRACAEHRLTVTARGAGTKIT